MSKCSQCGEQVGLDAAFECTYCEQVHCIRHRVPEEHDCLYRAFLTSPWKDDLNEANKYNPTVGRSETGKTAKSESRASTHTSTRAEAMAKRKQQQTGRNQRNPHKRRGRSSSAGKRHRDWEPESSSPDVAVDGSMVGDDTTLIEAREVPTWPRIRGWMRLQIKTPTRTVWHLVVIAVCIGLIYWLLYL